MFPVLCLLYCVWIMYVSDQSLWHAIWVLLHMGLIRRMAHAQSVSVCTEKGKDETTPWNVCVHAQCVQMSVERKIKAWKLLNTFCFVHTMKGRYIKNKMLTYCNVYTHVWRILCTYLFCFPHFLLLMFIFLVLFFLIISMLRVVVVCICHVHVVHSSIYQSVCRLSFLEIKFSV